MSGYLSVCAHEELMDMHTPVCIYACKTQGVPLIRQSFVLANHPVVFLPPTSPGTGVRHIIKRLCLNHISLPQPDPCVSTPPIHILIWTINTQLSIRQPSISDASVWGFTSLLSALSLLDPCGEFR